MNRIHEGLRALMLTGLCACIGTTAFGREPSSESDRVHVSTAFPTGERSSSLLLIEAHGPNEVRVGESYRVDLTVTNLTDKVALHDVRITPFSNDQLEFEAVQSSEHKGSGKELASHRDGNKNQNDGKETTNRESGKRNSDKKETGKKETAQKEDGKKHADKARGGKKSSDHASVAISYLMPGESKEMQIEVTGRKVGQAMSCMTVTYQPVVCVNVNVVKPVLQLRKTAPETVDICRPLQFKYVITNSGSGVAKGVVLRDELPDGLTTDDGKKVIREQLGDMPAGKRLELTKTVTAARGGKYSSRAVAESAEGIRVTSSASTIDVTSVDLECTIDGPNEHYVGKPIAYTITVANNGDAPSVGTELKLTRGEAGHIVRATEEGANGDRTQWNLGTIEPGEQKKVNVTVMANAQGEVSLKALATAACGRDQDKARAFARAEADYRTSVTALPALLLYVVDSKDNLSVGEEVTYRISVLNQGSGPDENVSLDIELPKQFKFVSLDGPTSGKSESGKVTIDKVDQIKAGQRLDWELTCKATAKGDFRTKVNLSSDYLQTPVPDVEPTRVIN